MLAACLGKAAWREREDCLTVGKRKEGTAAQRGDADLYTLARTHQEKPWPGVEWARGGLCQERWARVGVGQGRPPPSDQARGVYALGEV